MNAYTIFETIKVAYEASTQSNNKFQKMLNCIDWEDRFEADGEYYFCKGNLVLTTPSLDPFQMPWKPSALFTGGSLIEF